ncbi:hypothetical protein [Serratia ureilytica]|uniref:hypothetical protein n=1 Tax=Serratia ureilytica TaxID=300181 RepID=UPI0019D29F80|nr:hypothetical protein [Serratia ureilytica]MBN5280217.1 hypothetical protein [Serratia ureilytica]MBN5372053.1 hypothetical protein [Serratia ureilytica]HEI9850104.1 hypothetical protein [Serratia marcescens]
MKPIITLQIDAETVPVASHELVLDLNACGRGFITAETDQASIGKLIRVNVGYNDQTLRWFTGYVERDQAADNGFRRLFVRELVGVFEKSWPLSVQHPTLRQVAEKLAAESGLAFILPDGKAYTDTPIPHFVHSGTGWQLLSNLGRAFGITDYIWQQLPDGTVWLGAWEDSRFANLPIDIPNEYAKAAGAGNSITLPAIPSIRPGVMANGQRITRVALKDDDVTLTWTPLNSKGQPKQKSPFERQLETAHPELAAGLHLPKLARVEAPTEGASLGDIADPFRPRFAVDVQLLDEDGAPNHETPVYPAVALPVPMAGDESGLMHYPPAGTLVELAFTDGRPDKPFIRQVLPQGNSLPSIKPGEQLQQQRAEVFQRVSQAGDWQRETDQAIQETSATRTITADEETRTLAQRTTTIQATDSTTVIGTVKLLAGAIVQLSQGDYSIGTSGKLLVKADSTSHKIGQNADSEIGGQLTEKITGLRRSVSASLELIASQVRVGTDDTNVLSLLLETLDVVQALAQRTAEHTHSNTGSPTNGAEIAETGASASTLKSRYHPYIA